VKTVILSKVGLVIIFLCGIVQLSAQDAKQIESELKSAFENRELQLRNPYVANKLEFDSRGQLLRSSETGPWTTYGFFRVNQLTIKNEELEIDGKRMILVLESKSSVPILYPRKPAPKFTALITDLPLRIIVKMRDQTGGAVRDSLSQILQGGSIEERLATYWTPRVDLAEAIRSQPSQGDVAGVLEGKREVYLPGARHIQPPRAVYTPDPGYPPEAHNKHLSGTLVVAAIINEQGFPELLETIHRSIEGFDAVVLAKVSRWRFHPALMDGKPVPVLVNVEVNFKSN